MKKALLLIITLAPVWLYAQQNTIQFSSISGNTENYLLSSISKHTFESGKLITNFKDRSNTIEITLNEISNVKFGKEIVTSQAKQDFSIDCQFYPMPVQQELKVSFEAKTEASATLQILFLDGRIALGTTRNTHKGSNTFKINVSNLKQGIYLCRLSIGKQIYTKQIIKQ